MGKASCNYKIIVILLSVATIIFFCKAAYAFQESATEYSTKTSVHISNYLSNLSFEERVQCQKIIEEVYWLHRIWPAQNTQPKPPLDSIMSEDQIRAKVEDVIKKSNALDKHWKRPITAEQLQAEMKRMAAHTRQPAILKQIWASLNNDPYLIAECFARTALVDRLMRNWYSFDERFHGELKKQIQNEIARYSDITQMKSTDGNYAETEWIKGNKRKDEISERGTENAIHYVESEDEWEQLVSEYSGDAFAADRLGQLQEDENRYYIVISLIKEKNRIKVTIREWWKIPFDKWWNDSKLSIDSMINSPSYKYELPEINEDFCESNTWMNAIQPPLGRYDHTAIWTGTEMIIWGGYYYYDSDSYYLRTGGRYNPASDSWTPTTTVNAPTARYKHTAVWTGTEMIIWGGYGGGYLNTGGKYNPASDSWTPTSTTNAPAARYWHTAVWIGTEMIIWGGYNGVTLNAGGRYSSASDSWIPTSTTNAPVGRYVHSAVWTWTEMIVWGGNDGGYSNTGGRYNPGADSWTATSMNNVPTGRIYYTAVWAGTEMVIWGGYYYDGSTRYLNTGGRYNPALDLWTTTSMLNVPIRRREHAAIWTGTEMIIWGGYSYAPDIYLNTGGRYDAATDTWTPTSLNAPIGRFDHTAVWTGAEMIIWGGVDFTSYQDAIGRYCACRMPPSAISAIPSPNQIAVTWSLVPGEENYNVYRRYSHCQQQVEELVGDHVPGDTFIDSTVNPGKLYKYSVTLVDQCGLVQSAWVQTQSMGECILLPCFSGIENITYNQCAITVKWGMAISDCELSPYISYTIYRGDTPDFIPSPSNQIATCVHDNFYTDNNVIPGHTYYYIVRAEDSSANGNGPCNNGNIDTNLIQMSGNASAPNITLFFDGFESGTGNWSISSNWQQTNMFAHTGAYSAYPLYENNLQCALMTQTDTAAITATALTPQLHFWSKHYIENGPDAGIVEGSSDGSVWSKLALTPDYPGTTVPSAQACLGTNLQPAFTGDSAPWTEYISDLTSYAGTEFKMRFNFATNDSIIRTGWFIDDVNIDYRASLCTSGAPPAGKVLNNLFITKSNGNPKLDWTAVDGTCTVTNYAVYRGTLPWTFYNHNYITCYVSTVPPLTYTDINASGSYYYLVVPLNTVHEGSYGTTSYGTERPQGASACKWQKLLSCE